MNSRNITKIFSAITLGFAVQTAYAGNHSS